MLKKYFNNNRKKNKEQFLRNKDSHPRQSTHAEIEYLTAIANKPCGLTIIEKYKDTMQLRINWGNIDPTVVKQQVENLIRSKKNSFTISDML